MESAYSFMTHDASRRAPLVNESIYDYVLASAPRPPRVDPDFLAQNTNLNRVAFGSSASASEIGALTRGRNRHDSDLTFSSRDLEPIGESHRELAPDSRIAPYSLTSRRDNRGGANASDFYQTPLVPAMAAFIKHDVPLSNAIGMPSWRRSEGFLAPDRNHGGEKRNS